MIDRYKIKTSQVYIKFQTSKGYVTRACLKKYTKAKLNFK